MSASKLFISLNLYLLRLKETQNSAHAKNIKIIPTPTEIDLGILIL